MKTFKDFKDTFNIEYITNQKIYLVTHRQTGELTSFNSLKELQAYVDDYMKVKEPTFELSTVKEKINV